jgi:cation diffusion facilitator family transporter
MRPEPHPVTSRPDVVYPPPPPTSDTAFAWFRWIAGVLKASTRSDRAAIRRHHARRSGGDSMRTVVIAICADLAMSVAKAAAAVLTGSAALFAETLHSLADTGNQLLLLKGLRRARRRRDARHPFGYGAELFYWSLLAALGMFLVGGVLSAWEGVQRLLHESHVDVTVLGFAVLGLGCVLDGTSWLTSVRQFLGNAIAIIGLALHQLLGSPVPDALAAIAIGVLLAAIGLRLAGRNRALLTNRSDSPVVLDRIRELLGADPRVADVGDVASIYVGPHELLIAAEIQPSDALSGLHVRQVVAELRHRVAEAIPRAVVVFVTPVVTVEHPPAPAPWDVEYWLRLFPDHEQA